MKALVIGNGQLGSYVYQHWDNFKNIQIKVIDFPKFDITSFEQCQNAVKQNDIIINCAAYTNVDKAESEEEICFNINVNGPQNLAIYCKKYNKKLIHISSEVVYGSNDSKYKPLNENSGQTPLNIYSRSKMLGDQTIISTMDKNYIIIRSAWLFGPNNDHNFIQKIKKLLLAKEQIKVVTDQIGSLTSVSLVLNIIKKYIDGIIPDGIYNAANEGYTSRYENALLIKQIIESKCNVLPCSSNEFKRAANVAKNSCLDCSKLKSFYKDYIPTWQEDVENVLKGKM